MAESLVVCEQPNIVIPGGFDALYGSKPFPVEVGIGEMYLVPQISGLEPRIQAVTYLALLGETNPGIRDLAQLNLSTVKRSLSEGMDSFGITRRYALPHYGFTEKICQRTQPTESFDLGYRTRKVLRVMSEGHSRSQMARSLTIAPISVKSYKDYLSNKMDTPGNRTRLALMGIMSNEIGGFETTPPEKILRTRKHDVHPDATLSR